MKNIERLKKTIVRSGAIYTVNRSQCYHGEHLWPRGQATEAKEARARP